jgi:hypothetical protein
MPTESLALCETPPRDVEAAAPAIIGGGDDDVVVVVQSAIWRRP